MNRLKTVIHEIDATTRRISIIYPKVENDLANAGKHFTATQKLVAKSEYKNACKSRDKGSFLRQRAELITALAETKEVPKMNLKVTLQRI
jgi:septal ring factor EnvC (AmiA/AmiB activator)